MFKNQSKGKNWDHLWPDRNLIVILGDICLSPDGRPIQNGCELVSVVHESCNHRKCLTDLKKKKKKKKEKEKKRKKKKKKRKEKKAKKEQRRFQLPELRADP